MQRQKAGFQHRKTEQTACFLCFQDITAQEGHGCRDLSVAHGETLALWATSALKARWRLHLSQIGSTTIDQVFAWLGNHL